MVQVSFFIMHKKTCAEMRISLKIVDKKIKSTINRLSNFILASNKADCEYPGL